MIAGSVRNAGERRAEERRPVSPSARDFVDDAVVNVGQTVIAAGVAAGQSCVVQAQLVQDCVLKVVYADFVLSGTQVVVLSRHRTRINSSGFGIQSVHAAIAQKGASVWSSELSAK